MHLELTICGDFVAGEKKFERVEWCIVKDREKGDKL